MQTRTCTKCGEEKELTEYHKNKNGKFGVTSQCTVCLRKYRQRPEVKERRRKYQRKYRQRPEARRYLREYKQRPQTRERNRTYRQDPDRFEQIRKRDREDKRLRRELGIEATRHIEIAAKHATRSGLWSDAEVKFLMTSELPLVDIALELGRTYGSVQTKRYEMRKKLESQQ